MTNTGRILRGLVAALALTAVLVGVPIFLAVAVGWPLPSAAPVWSDITSTLSGATPLDNHVVWKALAILIWIGWAQIALGALVELNAARRGLVTPALRGFGLGQGVAGYLIGAISLALPATATIAGPAPQPSEAHLLTAPAAFQAPDAFPTDTARAAPTPQPVIEHVVQRRENLWSIARSYLPPDASHADVAAAVRRIFDANVGRPQPDGATLTDGSTIRPGWTIRVEAPAGSPAPAAGARQLTVRPGDTLSGIARAQLGDAADYHRLFDANRGRPQPDGAALTDANLIRPGWILDLPTTSQPPGDGEGGADTPAPPPPPAVAAGTAPSTATENDITAPGAAGQADGHASGAGTSAAVSATQQHENGSAIPVGLIGGGLSTAGVVALLDRRRRAQQRHRRSGRHIPVPALPLQDAERRLRAGAACDQAVLVQAALRVAATAELPALRWIESSSDGVTLQLVAEAPPPAGFTAGTPDRWQSTAAIAELAADVIDIVPTPLLAPIGTTGGGVEVLVDLEAGAVTSVNATPPVVTDLLRSMAVALATAAWCEDATIILVGLDAGLASLGDVQGVPSLAAGLAAAEARVTETAAALASIGHTTTVTARAAGLIPDAWAPLVVISADAPTEAEQRRLAALARCPHQGVAVVCPGADAVAAATITVDDAGLVSVDGSPLELTARRLDTAEGQTIVDLLDVAATPADIAEPALLEPLATARPVGGEAPADVQTSPLPLVSLLDELDVLVRVMGEVEAVRLGADGEEPVTPAVTKALEAVAYLATRDIAVAVEDVQAALWPAGANSPKTFRNAITAARAALGTDRHGDILLPVPDSGRYDLSNRVATDYELFHELTHQADQLGDDDVEAVAALLSDALSLVRGEPYVGVGRNYAWVAQHRGIIVAEVVNAAEELAEISLELGDWRAAEWSARQGLRAFPCDERLYRILMRAAHAAGTVSGVRRVFHELCEMVADPDHGTEPEDTVHPETLALLENLSSFSPGAATA